MPASWTAEVPGTEPGDIQISLQENLLTIKGEKKQEKKEKDERYHLDRHQAIHLVLLPRDCGICNAGQKNVQPARDLGTLEASARGRTPRR